jgi:hypothetical protein
VREKWYIKLIHRNYVAKGFPKEDAPEQDRDGGSGWGPFTSREAALEEVEILKNHYLFGGFHLKNGFVLLLSHTTYESEVIADLERENVKEQVQIGPSGAGWD